MSKSLNASLTFPLKLSTQKVRLNLYENQISKTNFKSFSNQRSDFLFLRALRHSGTRRTFRDSQRALEHLRHSESTRALGYSERHQRALRGHFDTRALRHSGHSGTQALGHLRHPGT